MANHQSLPHHGKPSPALSLMLKQFTEKNLRRPGARELALTLKVHMHKGCTRDAHGSATPAVPCHQEGSDTGCLAGSEPWWLAWGDAPRQSAVASVPGCAAMGVGWRP